MKQLLKRCLLLVVMLTTIESYSNYFTIIPIDSGRTITTVSIDNVFGGSEFQIKDSEGVILYRENVLESGTYSRRFDLSSLPDAEYYFELDMKRKVRILPFVVKENVAEYVKDMEYEIIKPEVYTQDEHVFISHISGDRKTWRVSVYYEGSELAYSEKIKDVQDFKRIYDFSTSLKGNYIVILSSEGRLFRNYVHIQ